MSKVYTPHWKLRRIASRAVQVLARHKDKSPAFAAFVPTLEEAVKNFVELYDASRTARVSATEQRQAEGAIQALRTMTRGWLGSIARDIPGFDMASYTDRQDVADDVIGSAERLLEVCKNFRGANGEPLPYQAGMLEALGGAIEKAAAELAQTQERRAEERAMLERTREAASRLQSELVAFRRTLRAVIGTSHVDYQALRAQPTTPAADEVEEVVQHPVDPLANTSPALRFTVPAATNGARSNGVHAEGHVA